MSRPSGHSAPLLLAASTLAAMALLAPNARPAVALPAGEIGGFVGYNAKSDSNELGDAPAKDEVVQGNLGLGLRGGVTVWGPIFAELEFKYVRSQLRASQHSAVIFAPRISVLYEFMQGQRLRPFARVSAGLEVLQSESPRLAKTVDSEGLVGIGGGVRYNLGEDWGLRLDLLAAATPGRNDKTTMEAEAWLGGFWQFGGSAPDADGDGVADKDDRCPDQAEDNDGFEDADGCPDADNDGDGIVDTADKCPLQAEDKDGFEDEDGCPEFDDDKDGIPDATDKCPRQAEDKDSFQDEDGCPDVDNDKDGVPDTADKCPLQAGPAEEAGCPISDRDGDGIPDKLDKCPDKKETFNGKDDEDGCPDGLETVVVTATAIDIRERVFFGNGNATIEARSFGLLDTVAGVLQRYPRLTLVSVQGHTDDVGADDVNQELSQQRAAAVLAYLSGKGITAERMQASGYGASRPLCTDLPALMTDAKRNKSKIERCREQNRRVQFMVLEVDGNPIEPTSPAPSAAPLSPKPTR